MAKTARGDTEFGLDTLHDGVEERPEQFVAGRDPVAEVDAVRILDTDHEACVARDVGEEKVLLPDG